ncbi:MAG TPA: hypothetical protein VMB52_00030 [Verrucomicrobiae bacterium]|nr:hypothetical protein [Verrucomicrobiae bacterium]
MKKGLTIPIIIVAIVVLAGAGYILFHHSNKPTGNTTSASSTTVVNNAVLMTKTSSNLGSYLTKPNGQPLYTYGGDSNGISNCTGSCLVSWPAYQDTGATTGLPAGVATIKRTDNGEVQFTYNGMPLYTFVGDKGGQATGNGVADFAIAKPGSSSASSPASSSSSSSDSSSTNGSSW